MLALAKIGENYKMSFILAICIGFSIDGFYKFLSMKYETNYFSLSDYEGEKRMSFFGYSLFRFLPPLFALTLSATIFKTNRYYWFLLFAVLFFGVIYRHSKAFYKQLKLRYYAPSFLHILVIIMSVVLIAIAHTVASVYELNQYLPNKESVIDNLWSALILTVILGLFFKFVSIKKIERNELLLKSLSRIDINLLHHAKELSEKYDADKTVVASILALENLHRPKWVRNIERTLPWVKTRGIMQVKTDKKIDDAESIEIAIKNFFKDTKKYWNNDDYEGSEVIRKSIISKYNKGESYYQQIESYGWYIVDRFKDITGDVENNSLVDMTKDTYEKSAKGLTSYYDSEGDFNELVELVAGKMKSRHLAMDIGCGSGRNALD
jgi:hypothetical protein